MHPSQDRHIRPNLPCHSIHPNSRPSHLTTPRRDITMCIKKALLQVFDEYFVRNAFSEGYSLYPILLRPKSRGKISLRSSNPQDYPKIQPNYLTHPDDVKVLVEGLFSIN